MWHNGVREDKHLPHSLLQTPQTDMIYLQTNHRLHKLRPD